MRPSGAEVRHLHHCKCSNLGRRGEEERGGGGEERGGEEGRRGGDSKGRGKRVWKRRERFL